MYSCKKCEMGFPKMSVYKDHKLAHKVNDAVDTSSSEEEEEQEQ